MASPKYMVIHMMAPNDSNGNPRRLFVVVDAAAEYVPLSEYNKTKKHAQKHGIYVAS